MYVRMYVSLSAKHPTIYLGTYISKYRISNDEGETQWWAMSTDHLKKLLQVVEDRLTHDSIRFKSSSNTADHPLSSQSYRPELDSTEECYDKKCSCTKIELVF